MSIAAPIQSHFDGGEISPLCYGRVDSDRYKSSLALCRNWITTLQGGLIRRPGTYYINAVKNSSAPVRLIPFTYSTVQSYMLEFGYDSGGYIRFYTNYGLVTSGGAYEVAHPYAQSELASIGYTQKADVLYLVHPNHPPMKLSRFGATNWQLATISFKDGPYGNINSNPNIYIASGSTGPGPQAVVVGFALAAGQAITGASSSGGAIQVTATAHGLLNGQSVTIYGVVGTTEANGAWVVTVVTVNSFILNGSTFVNAYSSGGHYRPLGAPNNSLFYGVGDVGSNIRIQFSVAVNGTTTPASTDWYWATITSITNAYTCDVQAQGPGFPSTAAVNAFCIGPWSSGNYPSVVAFHQDRLLFSGANPTPNRIDGSVVGDYENFNPTSIDPVQPGFTNASGGSDDTVTDSSAFAFTLEASDVNAVSWMSSDPHGLLAGALSSEWFLESAVGSGISPLSPPSVTRGTKWGAIPNIQAVQIGPATIFVQRGGRKIREMLYYFDINGFRTTDLTELAEHITSNPVTGVYGVNAMAFQSVPYPVVWLLRNDGALIGMTYDREIGQLRTGWHQHQLGGQSDPAGTPPIIETMAVIPDPTGVKDDLWMVVNRWINGATVRSIEYLTKVFEDADPQQNAFFLDSGLTLNNPITITGISRDNPCVVTAPDHGLSNGNIIRIDGVIGFTQTASNFSAGFNTNIPIGESLVNGQWFTVAGVTTDTFELTSYVSPMGGTAVNLDVSTGAQAYVSSGQVRLMIMTISGLSYLQGEAVYAYADGCIQGPFVVNSSGQITLTEKASVVSVGYAYNSDAQLLRFEAGSRNGTSIGKTRRFHRIGIMVHRSQNLQIGQSFGQMDPVQFRQQGVDVNSFSPGLFSGVETHEAGFDYDLDNMLCLRAGSPMPCTLLAVAPQMETQDRA